MASFKYEDPNDIYAFSDDDEYDDALNLAAEKLLDSCTVLLEEVESFLRQLRRNKVEKTVELRLFLNQVKAEHRSIQGLCLESPESSKSKHGVKACNLPYLEALWKVAKSTTSITALCKTFTIIENSKPNDDGKRGKRKKTNVTVDVVAQNGLQWIKVSLLTERRLLFELAKAGWEGGYDSQDEQEESSEATLDTLATSSLSLTTLAESLVNAAAQHRVQYLHPSVHIILPNLHPSSGTLEINEFLSALSSRGVHVQCGTSPSPEGFFSPPRSVSDLVEDLSSPTKRYSKPLSDPLNLDTTILLALVSDISTSESIPVEDRFHPAILKQLELEAEAAILPVHLWPALAGRNLVCTLSAHARFDEIVSIVGSEKEQARAAALVDIINPKKSDPPSPDSAKRCATFQKLCVHPLPNGGLILPVRTLEEEYSPSDNKEEELEVIKRVAGKLSSVNRSVFIVGWRLGLTTVSSNRTVAKIIEGMVQDDEVGPDVYVVETARSLVGKAKRIEI